MRPERCEQRCGKISIEVEIFLQLRQAQKFRAHIRAPEPERRFAPLLDCQRGINSLGGDVARLIVVDDFYVLQIPRFRFWPVESVSRNVIGGDIVVRVLLKNLHIVKRVAAEAKILNKPGAGVSPIAKDLSFDIAFGPRSRFGEKSFARELGVRCKRIIERHACCYRE